MKRGILIVIIGTLCAVGVGLLGFEAYENAFGNKKGTVDYGLESKIDKEEIAENSKESDSLISESENKNSISKKQNENIVNNGDVKSEINEIKEKYKNTGLNYQSKEEAYELFYKAEEAYNSGNFERAIEFNDAINSMEFSNEIGDRRANISDASYVNSGLKGIKELMEKNENEKAYENFKIVTGKGVLILPQQQAEFDKIKIELEERGIIKKKEFNSEMAKEYYRRWKGSNPDDLLSYIGEDNHEGQKRILLEVRNKNRPNTSGYIAVVSEDGSVATD